MKKLLSALTAVGLIAASGGGVMAMQKNPQQNTNSFVRNYLGNAMIDCAGTFENHSKSENSYAYSKTITTTVSYNDFVAAGVNTIELDGALNITNERIDNKTFPAINLFKVEENRYWKILSLGTNREVEISVIVEATNLDGQLAFNMWINIWDHAGTISDAPNMYTFIFNRIIFSTTTAVPGEADGDSYFIFSEDFEDNDGFLINNGNGSHIKYDEFTEETVKGINSIADFKEKVSLIQFNGFLNESIEGNNVRNANYKSLPLKFVGSQGNNAVIYQGENILINDLGNIETSIKFEVKITMDSKDTFDFFCSRQISVISTEITNLQAIISYTITNFDLFSTYGY